MNSMTRRAEQAALLQKSDRFNFGRAAYAIRAHVMARLDEKAATLAAEYAVDFGAPADAGAALLEAVRLTPVKHFVDGEHVVEEGEPAHALCIVISGTVRVEQDGHVVRRCTEGDSFGEMALFAEATPSPGVIVEGGASVLRMGRKELALLYRRAPLLKPTLRALYRQQLLGRLLPPTAALAALREHELATLFGYFGVSQVSAGAEVVRVGAPGNVLTIIASGQARRGRGEGAVDLKAGDVIGEEELLRRTDFTETVESVTSMISFTLTWEALTLVMEDIPGGMERVRQRLDDRESGVWPPPPPPPAEELEEVAEADMVEVLEDLDEAGEDGFDERVIEEILQERQDRQAPPPPPRRPA